MNTPVFSQAYVADRAQAESHFGFSPSVFIYEPEESYQQVYGEIFTSLPIQFTNPVDRGIQTRMNNHPFFSSSQVENYSALLTQIRGGMPLYDGSISFSYQENFSLRYTIDSPQTQFNFSQNSDNGNINLLGKMSSSFNHEQNWKTLSIAYSLHLARNQYIGFRMHKHLYQIETSGDLSGFWNGNITKKSNELLSQFPINYREERFNSQFDARMSGSQWSPEFTLRWKRLKWRSQISVQIPLNGHVYFKQQAPYFLDSLSLNLFYDENELLSDSLLLEVQKGSTTQYNVDEKNAKMSFQTPELHSLEWEAIPENLEIGFTWFRRNFALNSDDQTYFPTYSEWTFQPNFILSARGNLEGLSSELAWLVFDSSNSDKFFKEVEVLALSKWLDYGHVPYANIGWQGGDQIKANIQYTLLPTQSLLLGVRYEY